MQSRDQWGVGAFALYLTLAVLYFGRGLSGHLTTVHIGEGPDPAVMMWFLAWWPYALARHLNPFITHAIWAPTGFNLTWAPGIPLLSLAAAPLTQAVGPTVSLNVLCFLGIAISGWSAFLLCRYISGHYAGGLLGGYIFGFSPYMLGQMLFARLHSIWIFPIPLIVLLAARWLNDEISAKRLTFALTLLLLAQFLLSPEMFVTFCFFAAIALLFGWSIDVKSRRRLEQLTMRAGIAGAATVVLVIPYLREFLFNSPYSLPVWSDHMLSADLLNLAVPNQTNEIGRLAWFTWASGPFNWGEVADTDAFLAWPLIAITVVSLYRYREDKLARLLGRLLATVLVLMLGPTLVIRSHVTFLALPWRVLAIGPLKNAATVRFSQYAALILAITAALWLSRSEVASGAKLAVTMAILLCLLPNLASRYWVTSSDTPRFFATDAYKKYINRGENVFVLPVWPKNDAIMWQAQSHMYFNLAQGAGPWPSAVAKWPIFDAFAREEYVPDASAQFKGYLCDKKVSLLILDNRASPLWSKLVASLSIEPTHVEGVSLYRLSRLNAVCPEASFHDLRQSFDEKRLARLILGVQAYLSRGGKVQNLIASQLLTLGLLPSEDIVGPSKPLPELPDPADNWNRDPAYRYGIVLFTVQDKVVIGERAWRPTAEHLLERFRGTPVQLRYFPPAHFTGCPEDQIGLLWASFDRAQLAETATIAARLQRVSQSDSKGYAE